jgi:hypothetical protein
LAAQMFLVQGEGQIAAHLDDRHAYALEHNRCPERATDL